MNTTYIAFLRGINVGGKNRLKMDDLSAVFSRNECSDVKTYIQSGNVVFTCNTANIDRLDELVSKELLERFSINSPIVILNTDELSDILNNNPFVIDNTPESELHVTIFSSDISTEIPTDIKSKMSANENVKIGNRAVYLHLPNGYSSTKLTNAYLEKVTKSIATTRNWKTMKALYNLWKEI